MRTLVFILLLLTLSSLAFSQPELVKRNADSLLNQYYSLKKEHPEVAKKTLEILLKAYPRNITALKELSYWYLQHKEPRKALIYFLTVHELDPKDAYITLQIAYISQALGDQVAAQKYFTLASQSTDEEIKGKALAALTMFKSSAPQATSSQSIPIIIEPPIIPPPGLIKRQVQRAITAPLISINLHRVPKGPVVPEQRSVVTTTTTKPATIPSKTPATHLSPTPPPTVTIATKEAQATATQALPTPTLTTGTMLLNQYYELKKIHPGKAKKILELLIHREPNNVIALTELGYLELAAHNNKAALDNFEKVYKLKRDDKIAMQIGFIAFNLKNNKLAKHYFEQAAKSKDSGIRSGANKALKTILAMEQPATPAQLPLPKLLHPKLTYPDYLLNKFYEAQKEKNSEKGKSLLTQLLQLQPENVTALKEMGFLYLQEKNQAAARPYILRAYELTRDYALAQQMGYIENALGNNRSAYYYFKTATHSSDPKIRLASNIAMTNLAGWQTKFLPDPFFADVYTSPFYFSRFDLGVFPNIFRTGFTFGEEKRGEAYLSLRYTRDNRSGGGTTFGLPQIFEDNAAIFALGLRYKPFLKIPLYGYAEFGRSYDLVYRFRSRWRGDVRVGGFYINRWGRKATYADHLQFPLKWAADAYADATYFTRFNNNFITIARFRPGLRLVEFHSSYLDAYLQGDGGLDTNHDFFNNFYEYGPGVMFVPYNRINLAIRFVTLRGYYIPVNSPSPNPYGSHYNNKIVLLEYYARF